VLNLSRQKWSVPKKPKNAFKGNVTRLSKSEIRSHGKDVNCEVCPVCGKEIIFTYNMLRSDYIYKQGKKGKMKYYCGWSHYRQDGGGK